jgi:hypothetical protein
MSPLIRARLTALFLAVALPLHTQPALPQQRIPDSQEPILTFVHDFLQVFYPELLTKKQTLKFCMSAPADDPWRETYGVYFTRGGWRRTAPWWSLGPCKFLRR